MRKPVLRPVSRVVLMAAGVVTSLALAVPATAVAAPGGATTASPARAPASVSIPAAPPVTSTFDFSNGNIAHFHATLTFHSDYTFTISGVRLADTNCDSRSVLALAEDQNFAYAKGTSPGVYTWKNSSGCGSTLSGATYTFESSDPVQYVRIALYAANLNGSSSIVYSLKHANPYY